MPRDIYRLSPPIQTNANPIFWMYPDVFNYAFTADEYHEHWQNIKADFYQLTVKECLPVVDGFLDDPSHLRYAESMHVLIQLSMLKLLYFGYLNGLNRAETISFSELFLRRYPLLSKGYINACLEPKNDETSMRLQATLMHFFNQHHSKMLVRGESFPHPITYFGENYIKSGTDLALAIFIQLDPQTLSRIGPKIYQRLAVDATLDGSTLRKTLIEFKLQALKERLNTWCGLHHEPTTGILTYVWKPTAIENPDLTIANLQLLLQEANELAVFWPRLPVDHHDFYVRIHAECIKQWMKDVRKDSQHEIMKHGQELYEIIEHLAFETAVQYLNAIYLNNDVAFASIDLESELTDHWIKNLYEDVVRNRQSQDAAIKAKRVATCRPYYIEDIYLNWFISMSIRHIEPMYVMGLIERLPPNEAYGYMVNHPELEAHIVKNSLFAKSYACQLLEDMHNQTYTPRTWNNVPKRFLTLKKAEVWDIALGLYDEIYFESEIAASFGFSHYLNKEQWEDAWKIILSRQKSGLSIQKFSAIHKDKLASTFYMMSEILSDQAAALLVDSRDYRQAELLYEQSLDLLSKILSFKDTDQYRVAINHIRCLLMDVMFKGDQTRLPVSMSRVEKALDIYKQIDNTPCSSLDDHLNQIVGQWYDVSITTLHQACLADGADSAVPTDAHRNSVLETVSELTRLLEEVIALRKKAGSGSADNRAKLAYAHFLLAECVSYFQHQSLDVISHYREACRLAPKQPFYRLQAVSVFESEVYRDEGMMLLKDTGLSMVDYLHWCDERWQPEESRSHHVGMPKVQEDDSESYLAQFTSWLAPR